MENNYNRDDDSIENITIRFSKLVRLLDNDSDNAAQDDSALVKLKTLHKDISGIQESVEKFKLFKEGQDLYTKWLLLAGESGLWDDSALENGGGDLVNSNKDKNIYNQLNGLAALSYNNRGYLKYLQVDFEGALQDYTRALKLNASLSCAYYNRGIIAYRLAFFDQAVQDMKAAVGLEPSRQEFIEGLKNVTKMMGSPTGHNFRLKYDGGDAQSS